MMASNWFFWGSYWGSMAKALDDNPLSPNVTVGKIEELETIYDEDNNPCKGYEGAENDPPRIITLIDDSVICAEWFGGYPKPPAK